MAITYPEMLWTDGGLEIRTPYNEAFLADFKDEIRRSFRHWDNDFKVWIVEDFEMAKMAADVVRRHFPDVDEADMRTGQPA
jgi:hypothetical protein